MTLRVHLVRHAPTQPNAQRRYPHVDEDAALTPQGEALAGALRLPRGARAFTSPSRRARDTARLAGFPAAQPTPALREAAFGVMAGFTWAQLEAQHGAAVRGWLDALRDPRSAAGPPGGESGQAFHARVQGWLDTLPVEGEVVAFTHAGPLHAALRGTVGLEAVETPPGTAVTLVRGGGVWWLSALRPPAALLP